MASNHDSNAGRPSHASESSPLLQNHDPHTFADGIGMGSSIYSGVLFIDDFLAHEGESGRTGFHFRHFLTVTWTSSSYVSKGVNILWPIVPIAIVLNFVTKAHLWIFAMSYIAMIPAANLLGFAGQEFARKTPKVAGILIETTFGSIVEIILFMVLLAKHTAEHGNGDEGNMIPIIQAAILGSILTNLLLCLGLCFFAGGEY
jgi:Ca2+:H+ antiporter